MKTRLLRFISCSVALLCAAVSSAFAQGTAFTYQGRLNDGTAPASGSYDLTFALHGAVSGPAQVGASLTNTATLVSNGLFTVPLDFGNQFPGANRWLEIGVRTNGASAFTTLAPRQALSPTPYAVYAPNAGAAASASSVAAAGITGTIQSANIAAGSISSTMLANGAVTTTALADGAVTAAKVATASNWFALTIANPTPAAGDQFGFSMAAMGSDRVLIGAHLDDTGATDAGAAYLFGTNGTLITTFTNPTPADSDWFGYAVAAVGNSRVLIGAYRDDTGATDAGAAYLFSTNGTMITTFTNPTPGVSDWFGFSLAALGSDRVLIGAFFDDTGASDAGAAYLFSTNGTLLTTFTNPTPAIADKFGYALTTMGSDRVLIGAYGNDTGAGAAYLFSTNGTLITTFTNPTPADFDSFGFVVAAFGSDRVLISAVQDDAGATDAGAVYLFNTNGTLLTTFTNPTPAASDNFGISVAALGNDRLVIGANLDDTGAFNAGAAYLFSTNGTLLTSFTNPTLAASDHFGSSVLALGSDRVLIGASSDSTGAANTGAAYLFIMESYTAGLVVDGVHPTGITTASLQDGAVTLAKLDSGIGVWTRSGSAVFRLEGNVGIGTANPVSTLHVVGDVLATGTIFGNGSGLTNLTASNLTTGTVPNARLSTNVALRIGGNVFNGTQIITNGNVGIGTNNPVSALHVVGTVTATAFNPPSDRNLKENFVAVSSRDVLEKVAGLSISRWNFKGDTATLHVGPMAQDFHAAFGLGTDDRHIATVDADGVALAAIQGLNQKVEAREASLRKENAELKARLERLERMLEAKGVGR